jgi:DNA polymerase III delta prime subunit
MGAEVHHVASRQCDLEAVERLIHACHYTPFNGGWHVCIIDEADRMSLAAQHAFLSALDTTGRPLQTIFIFTANETKLLEKRFLSRCRIVRFEGCRHITEGVEFLRQVWQVEAGNRPAPDFAALLTRNEHNLRACLNDLEMELLVPGSLAQFEAPPPPKPDRVVHINCNPRRAAALKAWETIRARRAARG